MVSKLKEKYCCCNTTPLYYGIFLIGLHSLIHGTYGTIFVITSSHRRYSQAVNYTIIASQACFIPAGIAAIWSGLYESWKGATCCVILFVLVTIFNLVGTIWYFYHYFNYNANSLFDKNVFWRNNLDWVEADDVPFTFWHMIALINILITGVWIYYTLIILKYRGVAKCEPKMNV